MKNIINEDYLNDTYNLIKTGYPKVLCNPKNLDLLSEVYPDIAFTTTNYVKEGEVILFKPNDISKNSIKKFKMRIG